MGGEGEHHAGRPVAAARLGVERREARRAEEVRERPRRQLRRRAEAEGAGCLHLRDKAQPRLPPTDCGCIS